MPAAKPYPLFLALSKRPVLIVGGGAVGARKAAGLLQAGARVTVVSPAFDAAFAKLKGLTKIRAAYSTSHVRHRKWILAFAATDVAAVNARVQKDATAAGILCCRCDDPARGDFANGAAECIGDVIVSISTGGASPSLAMRIQEQAVGGIDPILARLAGLHSDWRRQIKKSIRTIEQRKTILRRLAGDEMIACLRRDGRKGAERLLKRWLTEFSESESAGGRRGK
jgi:precorrin-2 dehydrogenase/sirohydrochlorin ferrochelatase